jgi:hypothetical protein
MLGNKPPTVSVRTAGQQLLNSMFCFYLATNAKNER